MSNYNSFILHNSNSDTNDFLHSLESRLQDWQIEQAGKAVDFYIYYNKTYKEADLVEPIVISSDWDNIVIKIRESCKFQHKSYSTEKSYVHWISRFEKYLGSKNPAEVNEEDVKTS